MAFALMASERTSAQIETLVMPGDVIEGHADIEKDCDSCHAAFKRSQQRALCMNCHEEVAADIETGTGFHGRDRRASKRACANCHTDHEGRDANIVDLDESSFDHDLTDFALSGKHVEAQCDNCHDPDNKHRDTPSGCVSCHDEDNVHEDFLGTECNDCHAPSGWNDVDFDHDSTGFTLIGRHTETVCLDCHADHTFQSTPDTCFGCHESDDAHDGRSGTECGNCHSPTGWGDTSFDHSRDTRFALDGKHASLSCSDCHSDDPFADALDDSCFACHEKDDNHDGHFGASCDTCHSTESWPHIHFDHGSDTNHALNGAHESIECNACHVEPVFELALQGDCFACHEEDDAHKGTQGISCNDCHNEDAWADEVFFDHGLTRFPLLGSHSDTACDSCHESRVFADAPTNCVDCHRDDDAHDGRFASDCALCHNPVDWAEWRFDHDTQTHFELQGAHASVACDSCHRQSLSKQSRLGQRCGDCHRADDIHDGEFGPDCGRCHSAESFREVRSIQ